MGEFDPLSTAQKSMDTFGTNGHPLTGEAQQTAEDLGTVFDKVLFHA